MKEIDKEKRNAKVLCYGEVLWDILPNVKRIGGALLNVTYHLHKLGVDVNLASKIGRDDLGQKIKTFMKGKGLSTENLQTDPDYATSTVEAQVQEDHEVTYKIIENVAWDFIEYEDMLKTSFENTGYIVYGSLATRSNTTRDTLFKILNENPRLIKVLDVNLRPPFYSKELLSTLLKKADIVKMNENELEIISKWFECQGSTHTEMRNLKEIFDLKMLVVTMGGKGAILLDGADFYVESGRNVKVKDTIGSGDAFLAGFLSAVIAHRSPQEILKKANKMGGLIAGKPGGCPEYEVNF